MYVVFLGVIQCVCCVFGSHSVCMLFFKGLQVHMFVILGLDSVYVIF